MTQKESSPEFDPAAADPRSVSTLLAIMRALRTPVTGCPWDLEQNLASIAPYTIEEAYEVAAAIEEDDLAGLADELGDLLLQVVYHAQLASEQGAFGFEDVVAGICRKMVRRHPHVFGRKTAGSPAAAKGFWEEIKSRENAADGKTKGTLSGIPAALPALTRAIKLQIRAARVGFDWPSSEEVIAKISEEAGELLNATGDRRLDEFGDLLFSLTNLARHLELDPEAALRRANAKFERRFSYIETKLAAQGRSPSQSALPEMDALWNEAKMVEE
jgi:MazG family protein